jgi:hypothetical protein
MLELACHPEQAFFAQRGACPELAEGIWASRAAWPALSKRSAPKGRVFCDTIIARLARFLTLLEIRSRLFSKREKF